MWSKQLQAEKDFQVMRFLLFEIFHYFIIVLAVNFPRGQTIITCAEVVLINRGLRYCLSILVWFDFLTRFMRFNFYLLHTGDVTCARCCFDLSHFL